MAISEITLAELFYGAEKSQNSEKNKAVVNDFVDKIMILPISDSLTIYAKEKARLRSLGTIISDFDLLIGASAISKGLTLVTKNVSEFIRLTNIKIEDWTL